MSDNIEFDELEDLIMNNIPQPPIQQIAQLPPQIKQPIQRQQIAPQQQLQRKPPVQPPAPQIKQPIQRPQSTGQLPKQQPKSIIKKQNVRFNDIPVDEQQLDNIIEPQDDSIVQDGQLISEQSVPKSNNLELMGVNIHYETLYLFIVFVLLSIFIWYYANKAEKSKAKKIDKKDKESDE